MSLQWKDELSIDIVSIDNQHRELFRRFGLFLDACQDGQAPEKLQQLLQFLLEYAEQHFREEEQLQAEAGYDRCAEHRKEHAGFAERLRQLELSSASKGVSTHHIIDTNTLLFNWLVKHISVSDRAFAAFYRNGPLK